MLEFKYDTQLLIEGENLDEDKISEYFTNNFNGDCLLAVGDEELIKIHFHTNEPWKVLNGIARQEQEESNCWEAPIGEQGAEITLTYDGKLVLHQIQLTFDTNLTKEIMPSLTRNVRNRQVKGLPDELVRDYDVCAFREGKEVFCKEIHDNYQRLNRIPLGNVICDTIKVTVHRAYGIHFARIFEIRTY